MALDSETSRRPILHGTIILGIALGSAIAVSYLPGGYDAFVFYLKYPDLDTTAPYWVYLLTYPISLLGWPLGWQVLSFLSVLAVGAAALVWGNQRWWIAMLSAPMVWNIWLGQIEIFPALGLLLAGLVIKKKLHPAWLGIAWLALATKPQVGLGLILFFTWWMAKDHGLKVLLPAGAAAAVILGITMILWPGWPYTWLATMRTFEPTWWNASIWPYGLVAWPLAILARPRDPVRRLRLFAAASLLGSPYFAMYHCLTLLALCQNPLYLLISWLVPLLGAVVPGGWMIWGWVLPISVFAIELASPGLFRQATEQQAPPRTP